MRKHIPFELLPSSSHLCQCHSFRQLWFTLNDIDVKRFLHWFSPSEYGYRNPNLPSPLISDAPLKGWYCTMEERVSCPSHTKGGQTRYPTIDVRKLLPIGARTFISLCRIRSCSILHYSVVRYIFGRWRCNMFLFAAYESRHSNYDSLYELISMNNNLNLPSSALSTFMPFKLSLFIALTQL